jgi:HK97 family phage major capsid protein
MSSQIETPARSRGHEIRARMDVIKSDLDAIEANTDLDEETQLRADALLEEFGELDKELAPIAEREVAIAAMRSKINDDRARLEATAPSNGPITGTPELVTRNSRLDPFARLEEVRQGITPPSEIRARAKTVIERFAARNDHWQLADEGAEHATELIEKKGTTLGTNVARHLLMTGSPEYLASFEQYVQDPAGFSQRAALSLTPANGGYLVPFTLDPTIILTNAGSANPYRRLATIKTTATNNWNGVTSAGVSAEWTAEGTEAADATPTVGNLQITPQKADAYLFGSFEVLADSDFATQLPELLADAKDRLEESAFAVGTGSGMPWGVIPRGTSQNRAGTAGTGPALQDAYSLMGALPARWRAPGARNAWVMNLATMNLFRQVASFTGSTQPLLVDGAGGSTMLGYPVLESTSVLGTYTTGNKVMAFGDMRQYYIVDRVGMSVVYDPVVLGANRRPTGQGAWYAFWRVGADVSTSTAIRVFATLT